VNERSSTGSFWPHAAQRVLLQIALGPAEQAAARWDALQPLDVSKLPTGSFGLLPLLYERLAALAPDEPQLQLLHGTYRSTWYRNQLLLERLARLLAPLRARGIDALVVAGAAAVRRWYPALGSRPVSPLELLVPPGAVQSACAVCAASGWRPAGVRRGVFRFVDDGGAALVVYAGAPAPLVDALGPQRGYAALRERAAELPDLEGAPLVLDPADELLRLCATGARTVLPPSCQWLIDVHQLLASDHAPPVEQLLARARQFRVLEPLRATVHYLDDLLGATSLELGDARGNRRERLAFRLAGVRAGRLIGPAQRLAAQLQSYGFRAETSTRAPRLRSPKRRTAAS
jgi:Uncharacterised nucleotidyltransferase